MVKTENCLYIYIWYVRIPYMRSALFVRDAIFPHCILGSCTVLHSKRVDFEYGVLSAAYTG